MELDPLELLKKVKELNNKKRVKWSTENYIIEHEDPFQNESAIFDGEQPIPTDSCYPASQSLSRDSSWSSDSRIRLSRDSSTAQVSRDASSGSVCLQERSTRSLTSEELPPDPSNISVLMDCVPQCYGRQLRLFDNSHKRQVTEPHHRFVDHQLHVSADRKKEPRIRHPGRYHDVKHVREPHIPPERYRAVEHRQDHIPYLRDTIPQHHHRLAGHHCDPRHSHRRDRPPIIHRPPDPLFITKPMGPSIPSTEVSCQDISSRQYFREDLERLVRSVARRLSGEREDTGAFARGLREGLAMRLSPRQEDIIKILEPSAFVPPPEKPRRRDPCAAKPGPCSKPPKKASPNYRSHYGQNEGLVVEPCPTSEKAPCPGLPTFCKPRKEQPPAPKEEHVDPQFKNTVTVCLQMLLENAIGQADQANPKKIPKQEKGVTIVEKLTPCAEELKSSECKEKTEKGKSMCKICKAGGGKSRRRRDPNCQKLQCILASDDEMVEEGDNFCPTTESDLEDEPEEEVVPQEVCRKKCEELDDGEEKPETVSGTLCTFLQEKVELEDVSEKSVHFLEDEKEEPEVVEEEPKVEEPAQEEPAPEEPTEEEEVEEEIQEECPKEESVCDPCDIKGLLDDICPCPDTPYKDPCSAPCETRAVKSCEANVAVKCEPIVCKLQVCAKPASADSKQIEKMKNEFTRVSPPRNTIPAVVVLPKRTPPMPCPRKSTQIVGALTPLSDQKLDSNKRREVSKRPASPIYCFRGWSRHWRCKKEGNGEGKIVNEKIRCWSEQEIVHLRHSQGLSMSEQMWQSDAYKT